MYHTMIMFITQYNPADLNNMPKIHGAEKQSTETVHNYMI